MEGKSWFKYLLLITLIIIMAFWGHGVFDNLRDDILRFNVSAYTIIALQMLFYGGIGLLMGLDQLINEFKKLGGWGINLPKLLFMVIPSLYFSLGWLIFANNIFVDTIIMRPITILLRNNSSNFITVFQVIFGYALITLFYKKER